MVKINQKIVGYEVVKPTSPSPPPAAATAVTAPILTRPDALPGTTYRIKAPDAALYVTINDLLVGDQLRPFELFINSRVTAHQQWTTALTRVISAIFRVVGDPTFLVAELRSICAAEGGFFAGGKYVPSLVAAIGDVLETHLIGLGLIQPEVAHTPTTQPSATAQKLPICPHCGEPALMVQGGCETCQSCSYARCG